MAFSDDITARIGADTRPFSKALRTVKGQVAIVSKEMSSQLATSLKGWLGFLGPAGIIAGLKKIVDLAKKSREEGAEFTKDGWISHETANLILTATDAFERAYRIAVEFGAYTVGHIAKVGRILGAWSVTGDLAEADKQANMMANAEKEAAMARYEKEKRQRESVSLKKQELDLELKLAEATKRSADAQKSLARAKEDRSKFTLEDLAPSPLSFTGQLAKDKFNAQRIIALEAQANAMTDAGYGPESREYFNEADRLRKGLVNVTQADRMPFGALEKSANEQTLEMMAIRRILEEQGIKVKNAQ